MRHTACLSGGEVAISCLMDGSLSHEPKTLFLDESQNRVILWWTKLSYNITFSLLHNYLSHLGDLRLLASSPFYNFSSTLLHYFQYQLFIYGFHPCKKNSLETPSAFYKLTNVSHYLLLLFFMAYYY